MATAPRRVDAAQDRSLPGAGWRALVHEIAWEAVRRSGGDHADLEWLPGLVEAKLEEHVDALGDAGPHDIALAYDEVLAWTADVLSNGRPRRRRLTLSRSASPVRLR